MTTDPLVDRALREAGWFAHRNVPNDKAVAALTAAGYEVWDGLLAFLQEFSGLTLRFTRNGREDSVWIDAERAVAWADAVSVAAYEGSIGARLAPVGYAYHDHLLLLAGSNGRFFAAYDDFMGELGTSPRALLATLLHGRV